MEPGLGPLLAALAPLAGIAAEGVAPLAGLFIRVGAVVALIPGFGEQTLALRLRLAATVALTLLLAPMLVPGLPVPEGPVALGLAFLAEAAAGLALGLALRLMIMVLQLAGSIAAQATAIAQIFGAGMTPDPLPAIGNLLVIAGIAIALAAGIHVKAAAMIALSYGVLPFGRFPSGADLSAWGTAETARAFALAVSLAGPFAVLSLLYNVALGAINRAMPALMVAFVGAPFITGAALLLLMLAAPPLLEIWRASLLLVLADPFGAR